MFKRTVEIMVAAATVVIKIEKRGLTFFLQLKDYNIYKEKTTCNYIMKTVKNVRVPIFRLILYCIAKQLGMLQRIW